MPPPPLQPRTDTTAASAACRIRRLRHRPSRRQAYSRHLDGAVRAAACRCRGATARHPPPPPRTTPRTRNDAVVESLSFEEVSTRPQCRQASVRARQHRGRPRVAAAAAAAAARQRPHPLRAASLPVGSGDAAGVDPCTLAIPFAAALAASPHTAGASTTTAKRRRDGGGRGGNSSNDPSRRCPSVPSRRGAWVRRVKRS